MSFANDRKKIMVIRVAGAVASVCALILLGAHTRASANSLTRTADVAAPPAAVWAAIGPFCSIKDWHPVVGSCTEDGKKPPTRTLVTKDGKVTFVEMQVTRDDAKFTYAYNFVSSPFPVKKYVGTITVSANGAGSTVTWHGEYKPNPGKDKDANDAFAGVYESGLAAIKAKFAK